MQIVCEKGTVSDEEHDMQAAMRENSRDLLIPD